MAQAIRLKLRTWNTSCVIAAMPCSSETLVFNFAICHVTNYNTNQPFQLNVDQWKNRLMYRFNHGNANAYYKLNRGRVGKLKRCCNSVNCSNNVKNTIGSDDFCEAVGQVYTLTRRL